MTDPETETAPEGFNLDLEAAGAGGGIEFRTVVLEAEQPDDGIDADAADGTAHDDDEVMDDNPLPVIA